MTGQPTALYLDIGSEGVMSLRAERKFVGIELKGSYFDHCTRNLEATRIRQLDLLAGMSA